MPAPHTIYRGVRTLLPGRILTLAVDGDPGVRPYWLLREVAARGLAQRAPAQLAGAALGDPDVSGLEAALAAGGVMVRH